MLTINSVRFFFNTFVVSMANNDKNTANALDPMLWVDLYGDFLFNYAWIRVGSKEMAEDLVQDTFVAAWQAKDSFRGDSTELTWLTSILKRKVIDHYRKKSTHKEISASQFTQPFQDEDGMQEHWIMERAPKDWGKEFQYPLREEEFQNMIELCLSKLPEKWRSVFVLKVMEEIDSDEVCKELGCSASNLWVILHRTRIKLRECIENKWIK